MVQVSNDPTKSAVDDDVEHFSGEPTPDIFGNERIQVETLAISRAVWSRDDSGKPVVVNVPTKYQLRKEDLQILVRQLDDELKGMNVFMAEEDACGLIKVYNWLRMRFHTFATLLGEDETERICKENEAFHFRRRLEVVLPPPLVVRLRAILRDTTDCDPTVPVEDVQKLIEAFRLEASLSNRNASIKCPLPIEGLIRISRELLQRVVDNHPVESADSEPE